MTFPAPFFWLALRKAKENRRLTDALASANDTNEELVRYCQGWKSRAEALWLIADPSKRDGVLGTLDSIDSLPLAADLRELEA